MIQQYAIDTLLAQSGNRSDKRTGSVSAPIFLSTAYGHHELVRVQGLTIRGLKTQLVQY